MLKQLWTETKNALLVSFIICLVDIGVTLAIMSPVLAFIGLQSLYKG